MLILALVLCAIGSALAALDVPEHLEAPIKILHEVCQKQSGVAEEHILASREGFIPDVPELKCYIHCLLDHSGMVEPDGTIHHNEVKHLMTPSVLESFDHVTDVCKTKHGSTPCETAYLTLKCYFETLPKGSMLP